MPGPANTVVLYNLPRHVSEAALRLALGDGAIVHLVWGAAPEVGLFAIAKLSSEQLAWRLLEGSPTNTGSSMAPPRRSAGKNGAATAPLRVKLGDSPLCVAPSPIDISGVTQRAPTSKKAAEGAGKDQAGSPGGAKRPREPITCHNCGEEGHIIRECPKPKAKKAVNDRKGGASPQTQKERKPRHVREEVPSVEDHPASDTGAGVGAGEDAITMVAPKAANGVTCNFCGEVGHTTRTCAKKDAAMGRPSPAATQRAAPSARTDTIPAAPAAPKVKSGDACKKCGSTTHLTRQCTGATAAAASVGNVSAAPGPQPSAPSKLGTKKHLADSDDDGEAAMHQRKPKQPPAEAPRTAVSGGDGCKHCGATDHLSRLCPTKSSAAPRVATPSITKAVAEADTPMPGRRAQPVATRVEEPAPRVIGHIDIAAGGRKSAGGGDACKFCGSDTHLSRQCPSKGK
jgi:hypothetical protein